MALIKKIDTEYGVEVEYLKIVRFVLNLRQKHAKIDVGFYLNKDARLAGKSPLYMKEYLFEDTAFTFDPNSATLVSDLYDKIKPLPDFASATDDLTTEQQAVIAEKASKI